MLSAFGLSTVYQYWYVAYLRCPKGLLITELCYRVLAVRDPLGVRDRRRVGVDLVGTYALCHPPLRPLHVAAYTLSDEESLLSAQARSEYVLGTA
jgi:hypothetical protein